MKRTAYLVMVAITLAYLIIGAVVFHFVEKGHEKATKHKFASSMRNSCSATAVCPRSAEGVCPARPGDCGEGVSIFQIIDKNFSGGNSSVMDVVGRDWHQVVTSIRHILFCITLVSFHSCLCWDDMQSGSPKD
ncbi:hypothetical protein Btru_071248 [Bulinus truncatus]|nr:hypothetical protein Btru_071248 [Bulinus truncatus]